MGKMDEVWGHPESAVDRRFTDVSFPGPQVGVVSNVTAKGVFFTIKDFKDGRFKFGPATYQGLNLAVPVTGDTTAGGTLHHHSEPWPVPVVGNSVLVVFVGYGIANPHVVSWWA